MGSLRSPKLMKMLQDDAQEQVRRMFSCIESSGSAKTLKGKLLERKVISFECYQKIGRAECDTDANALLAEHLYQFSTEETLQDFAHVLKESKLPRQQALGERIEAALKETQSSRVVNNVYREERPPGSPCRPAVEGSPGQELPQTTGILALFVIAILQEIRYMVEGFLMC